VLYLWQEALLLTVDGAPVAVAVRVRHSSLIHVLGRVGQIHERAGSQIEGAFLEGCLGAAEVQARAPVTLQACRRRRQRAKETRGRGRGRGGTCDRHVPVVAGWSSRRVCSGLALPAFWTVTTTTTTAGAHVIRAVLCNSV